MLADALFCHPGSLLLQRMAALKGCYCEGVPDLPALANTCRSA